MHTCNCSSVFDREVKIHKIKNASKKASGRTRMSLALPDTSLMVPTYSVIFSNSDARK